MHVSHQKGTSDAPELKVWLLTTIWVLGKESGSSRRVTSAWKYRALSFSFSPLFFPRLQPCLRQSRALSITWELDRKQVLRPHSLGVRTQDSLNKILSRFLFLFVFSGRPGQIIGASKTNRAGKL